MSSCGHQLERDIAFLSHLIMDHKLGIVGTENCSSLIIRLVALMIDPLVICEAQSFWILIILNKCNALLLALSLCTNNCFKPRPSLLSIRNERTSVVIKCIQNEPSLLSH